MKVSNLLVFVKKGELLLRWLISQEQSRNMGRTRRGGQDLTEGRARSWPGAWYVFPMDYFCQMGKSKV